MERHRRNGYVGLVLLAGLAWLATAAVPGPSATSVGAEESLEFATFFDGSAPPAPAIEVAGLQDRPDPTAPADAGRSGRTLAPGTEPSPAMALIPDEGVLVATGLAGLSEITILTAPDPNAEVAWRLGVPTEFGGARHFQVIGETDDFVLVKVPVRPNGSTGWLAKAHATFSVTSMRVEVDVSDRRVQVFDGDTVVFETTGAVGRREYPTPLGEWYIRDIIPWDPNSVYGPWVLALSAFSEQIDEINGGQAVTALHGTSRPDQLGSAVSLGCVRLANDDITMVASLVTVGTPVIIRA